MAGMGYSKRPRKVNFSDREVAVMIQDISANQEAICVKRSNAETAAKKRAIWLLIALNVSALGYAERTLEDVKKKWQDMKQAVIRCVDEERRTGPPSKTPAYFELIRGIIGSKSNVLKVPEGGGDSLEFVFVEPAATDGNCEQIPGSTGHLRQIEATPNDPFISGASASRTTPMKYPPPPEFILTSTTPVTSKSEKNVKRKNSSDEEELWCQWLRGEIEKNKIKTDVLLLKKRKLMKELGDDE